MLQTVSEYAYADDQSAHTNAYLWPALKRIVEARSWPDARAFDLGCGNGATCGVLAEMGFAVTGVDPSKSGIGLAQNAHPNCHFAVGSGYDDLRATYGTFPLVISLEVIEHCVEAYTFAGNFLGLIAPGGIGILSTPYHGYTKNLALALSGRMDAHFTALWGVGHVKFFSIKTLGQLLRTMGAAQIDFQRIGRWPPLAKSMVAVITRPL